MATRTTKKRTNQTGRKRSRTQRREPSSGNLSSTLDPRAKKGPERKPVTTIPSAGPETTGDQSGDLEGLETDEVEGDESVEELAGEGQDLEAEELESFEKSAASDRSPLKPRKVPSRQNAEPFKNRNRI